MPDTRLPALAGVRALLLDLDGTVFQGGQAIPGVAEALEEIARRGIARRFLTNISSRPRSAIARELGGMGIAADRDEISSAPLAARQLLLDRGWTRALLMVPRPVREEDFIGIEHREADPQVVVLGDLSDDPACERLNLALRALLAGADLVALGRNRYFLSNGELVLDVGSFAAALEFAVGRSPIVVGKPSPGFFRAALESLGVGAADAAVVGDDVEADVGAGQAVGLRGVLVKTGKFRPADLDHPSVRPDAVLESLAGIISLL
jgi:phospholysine phosphohistidine inorganic pyrophosphate phosphatase